MALARALRARTKTCSKKTSEDRIAADHRTPSPAVRQCRAMRLARWLLPMAMLATTSALAAPAKHPAPTAQPRPAPDTADDPAASESPATDKLDAKALMQSGLKLYAAKDFLGALAVFRTAYTRFASTKILLNIGTTLTKLDRKAEAANAYQRYLDAADSDRAKHGEVTKVLGELDAAVTLLEIDVAPSE